MHRRPTFQAATCLFLACIGARADPTVTTAAGETAAREGAAPAMIFVARRKWHIDVGFAVRDLSPALAPVARLFPGARYLFFGFGDEHYLLSKNKGAPTMLGALLPGPGLVLVTALENSPQDAFGATHVLEIDAPAADALAAQRFVRRTLQGSETAENVEPYAKGPYADSLYFSAVPRYSALHTCNTWAAEALRSAGLNVRPQWIVFAGQLWRRARKLAARRDAAEGVPAQTPSR